MKRLFSQALGESYDWLEPNLQGLVPYERLESKTCGRRGGTVVKMHDTTRPFTTATAALPHAAAMAIRDQTGELPSGTIGLGGCE